jgi:hypothetical protein
MFGQSRRQAFIDAVAPPVEDTPPVNLTAGLEIVLHAVELLRDPDLLELNAKKALEAQRVIATAISERALADKHKREVEAELANTTSGCLGRERKSRPTRRPLPI